MIPVPETDFSRILEKRARSGSGRPAFTFLQGDLDERATLTFAELHDRARALAARLLEVAEPGERVLLLYPPGLDYVVGFYGCLYAGVISVPLYAPQPRTVQTIEAIAQDCAPAAVLTTELGAHKQRLFDEDARVRKLPWLATDTPDGDLSAPPAGDGLPVEADPDGIVYLQYTSGSTSSPKGVIIDHANALQQCAELARTWQVGSESRLVTWLPHFHDFGQVSAVLLPVYLGCTSVQMAPATFVQRPIRWLQAIAHHRGTHTAAPNFAYDLCVDGTTEDERAGLDLGTLVMACNGAEPVRLETLQRFQRTFAPYGLGPDVLCPGYGLAEATLKVTTKRPGEPLAWGAFDAVSPGGPAVEHTDAGRALVGCGTTEPGTAVAIVDPDTGGRLPDGHVGEIWVAGPSVSRGYWGRPEETAATFGARIQGEDSDAYLRTGDLGFHREGQLYVCGRIKDLVIVNGVNHYPHDMEETAEESHGAIRRGRIAAFDTELDGPEGVVVVAECHRGDETPAEDVARAIREAISRRHEIAVTVAIAETGAIPMTTSGKIQRRRCRSEYLQGRLSLRYRTGGDTVPSAGDPSGAAPAAPEPENTDVGSAAAALHHAGRAHIVGWITRKVLKGTAEVDARRSLAAHGLSSLHLMELHESLEKWAGTRLPHEWLWDSASVDELAGRVAGRLTSPAATTGSDR
ncbi:AMP-binding protein [Nonomuraea terrae]|uniref:AMP-binding protein n=1 Tax=Nonomuraea terrae TaxID=2530383 RepID=UPI00140461A4|nr:AMP-binding protein [Nonomuraea terrae]